jgi:hypothetical protein
MCSGVYPTENDCPVINSAAPPGKDVVIVMGKSGDANLPSNLEEYEVIIENFYSNIAELENIEESNYRAEEYQLWNSFVRSAQWDSSGNFPKNQVYTLLNDYEPTAISSRYASALAMELGLDNPEWVKIEDNLSLPSDQAGLAELESTGLPYEIHEVLDVSYFNSASNTAAYVELYHENDKIFEPIPMNIEADLPDSYGEDEGKANGLQDEGQLVTVRPNPFDQNFVLSFESSEEYDGARIVFYDLLGRTISDNNYGKISQVEIDGSKFPSGVLIYSVYLDGKFFDTGRIVKLE